MLFSYSTVKLVLFTLLLSILSSVSFAEPSHQFSVDLSSTDVDFDYGGEAISRNLGVTSYLNPVTKTGDLPYASTAFYSRTASISVNASKTKWGSLSTIVGGRILDSGRTKSYSISSFLAHKSLPVWGQLRYTHSDKTEWHFVDGSTSTVDSDSQKELALGAYVTDSLSMHTFFAKKEAKTYGLGLTKLFNLADFGFFETQLSLTRTKYDSVDVSIQNNVVRNLDIPARTEKTGSIQLSYFPVPETRISLGYTKVDLDKSNLKNHYYRVAIERYLTNNINISVNYSHIDAYDRDFFGSYETLGLNLGFEF